jgi:hypothetical protein
MTEEQLSALLRLKRFEQPPPQYFDQLLKDIHQRQRAELLRRPLWKIAAERVQTFFSEHSMGHLSYAGALASVLIVGVAAIGLMTSGGTVPVTAGTQVAANNVPAKVPAEHARLVNLQTTAKAGPILGSQPLPTIATQGGSGTPRYVIDARPVSYEPSSTVNF